MDYSIGEAAALTGLSAHTLRYYDRQGIMPFLRKDEQGNRIFGKHDLQWLTVIECMKISGFTIAEMREYAELVRQGDTTLKQRLALFEEHRQRTLKKIEELQTSLDGLNYKCWYYETAAAAGTERVHFTDDGYDQAVCYGRFKQWEAEHLDEPSRLWTLFPQTAGTGDPPTAAER